jgi:endonuclease YncB( thermonuclease family)
MARSTHPALVVGLLVVAAYVAAPAPTAAADSPGEQANIAQVIDGDTFVTTAGVKVRPLGIDSCEMSTPGGKRAADTAREVLPVGQVVFLVRQAGVENDQYGRALRYVQLGFAGGADYGQYMVGFDHTGVYQGKLSANHSASPEYLAALREADTDGRNCADTTPVGPSVDVDTEHHDDHHKGWLHRKVCRHWWC